MEDVDRASFPFGLEAPRFGIGQRNGGIGAPCDLRIGLADHQQLFVMIQQAGAHSFQIGNGIGALGTVIGSDGILYGVTVTPKHGQPPVGVGTGSAPAAAQADLLPVIDERGAGAEQIQIGSHSHMPARHRQVAGTAVHIMVGNERDKHGIVPEAGIFPHIIFHIGGIAVDVAFFGGFGQQPFRLGDGKAEAVDTGLVLVHDALSVPDLRYGIDIGLDSAELCQIALPESDAFRIAAVVDIFGGVKTEAVHTEIQIVPGDIDGFPENFLIFEVQLGHVVGEIAFVQVR